jgi:fumarate reductase subunit C
VDSVIESLTGKTAEGKKSRLPARLDYIQSATGLFLGLFMWAHMFFVSSILVSKDFMYSVTKMFEGSFIIEGGSPLIVTIAVAVVFTIFIIHAALAMRKFPINYRQYQVMKTHNTMINHDDTKLWFIQAYTGFAMFFLGSVHLYVLMSNPADIGPYASSDRVVSDWMWPLYILLLLAVELHGSIGLYRLCVKWGWFDGKSPKQTRANLKKAKWVVTVFFLTLGLLSLAAYIKIGIEHMDSYGEKYKPQSAIEYFMPQQGVLS